MSWQPIEGMNLPRPALGALGVPRALMMPDRTGICGNVSWAQRRLHASPGLAWTELEVLVMRKEESVRDTLETVARRFDRRRS
jgi:hypothetical protein